jgi:hypothetical protein
MRLVIKRWSTLDDVQRMTRQQVIDACDWLDAIEDAEAEEAAKNAPPSRPR